jgi:prepilin-type N-terminal cleavage/methylation domain-containing protein
MNSGQIFHSPVADTRIIRFRGFTLIELLIVIVIIGILATLLIPAIGRGTSLARRTKCLQNLRQIQVATIAYAGENNGQFPSAERVYGFPHELDNFSNSLGRYLDVTRDKIMFCPGELMKTRNPQTPLYQTNYTTYQYFNFNNAFQGTFSTNKPDLSRAVTAPVDVALWGCLTFITSDNKAFGHSDAGVARPLTGMNAVYPDGHAAWVAGTNLERYYTSDSGNGFYWPKPVVKP